MQATGHSGGPGFGIRIDTRAVKDRAQRVAIRAAVEPLRGILRDTVSVRFTEDAKPSGQLIAVLSKQGSAEIKRFRFNPRDVATLRPLPYNVNALSSMIFNALLSLVSFGQRIAPPPAAPPKR